MKNAITEILQRPHFLFISYKLSIILQFKLESALAALVIATLNF
ncbi:hypothetical protein K661_01271 [Piscirickettsia salmonis LF-89 = ATCC VR-1361]|nr:hypothetical protein K661_01271 [Piscirickettsia salmonis LF-89 = ATCC VR-1361]